MNLLRFSAAALMIVASAISLTAGSNVIPMPAGTSVNVHLTDSLSSTSSSAGQTFSVVVADPVVMQGWVVVQKGANGQGHVVAVNAAGKGGHEASISVQMDWVIGVSGQRLDMVAIKGKTSPLVFGVKAAFASNFQKGKDITVGPDIIFPAYTSADGVITVNTAP